jgi:hypothetical protein
VWKRCGGYLVDGLGGHDDGGGHLMRLVHVGVQVAAAGDQLRGEARIGGQPRQPLQVQPVLLHHTRRQQPQARNWQHRSKGHGGKRTQGTCPGVRRIRGHSALEALHSLSPIICLTCKWLATFSRVMPSTFMSWRMVLGTASAGPHKHRSQGKGQRRQGEAGGRESERQSTLPSLDLLGILSDGPL